MVKAAESGRQAEFMRAMLVLKMGCQQWLEDYGGDTSGFVYKSVKDSRRDQSFKCKAHKHFPHPNGAILSNWLNVNQPNLCKVIQMQGSEG